jgi:hypothetical protein
VLFSGVTAFETFFSFGSLVSATFFSCFGASETFSVVFSASLFNSSFTSTSAFSVILTSFFCQEETLLVSLGEDFFSIFAPLKVEEVLSSIFLNFEVFSLSVETCGAITFPETDSLKAHII